MKNKRILREQVSIEKMIAIYCKGAHHTREGLCEECCRLLEYAKQRLEHCVFREDKPVCAKCSVHCYHEIMRNKMRLVMRYSGPRILYKYPVLAILHFVDSLKSRTEKSK